MQITVLITSDNLSACGNFVAWYFCFGRALRVGLSAPSPRQLCLMAVGFPLLSLTQSLNLKYNSIMSHNKKNINIIGAPFKIGDWVEITSLPTDETFDKSFCGETGKVLYFEYDCGCGQSFPSDPMIGVSFLMAK